MTKFETLRLRPSAVAALGMYLCIESALFALVGLLKLPLPALWWAAVSVPPTLLLTWYLRSCDSLVLARYVGMYAAGFAGGALGAHGRQLYCLLLTYV